MSSPDSARLDVLVARELDLSRTQAATLIARGAVDVDGRHEKASYKPAIGENVSVNVTPPKRRAVAPERIELSVSYEDEHLLVVDKPAGMVVHPAPGNWSGTLVNALLGRAGRPTAGENERAGLVHRLDKETSGLLLVAKTERAHRRLAAALAARRVSRRYAVMIWGHLKVEELTIEKPLARSPRDRKRMAVVSTGRPARTDLVRLARFDVGDFLRAHLHTGRTHQIRVHLASVGHPVMGDDTYGGGGARKLVALPPKRHFLHAAWLRFHHPETGELLDIRSPLPADLRRALAAISGPEGMPECEDPLVELRFYDER
ncbi:MAG TPA: RluA family pseudouridine synthase [Gemmatimonadaceae bacterium]|nr:RluA family pseudouridine synthase [Gemmatimonadaceae bacterium]